MGACFINGTGTSIGLYDDVLTGNTALCVCSVMAAVFCVSAEDHRAAVPSLLHSFHEPAGFDSSEKCLCVCLQLDGFYFLGHLCRLVPDTLCLLVDKVFGDISLSREELSRLAPPAAGALTE